MDQALADVPPALSLGENMNVQPVKLPLFVNAQLGFMAVYLLADYDDLARKLILAHHTALIDRSTLERWLNEGAHALRSLFSLAQQYRYSGTTRDDFAAKNGGASGAGEIRRAAAAGAGRHAPLAFAPPIARRTSRSDTPPAAPVHRARCPGATDGAADGRAGDEGPTHDGIAPISHATRFVALEQADFQRLEHAGYLKGLYSLLRVRESGELGQPVHGAA